MRGASAPLWCYPWEVIVQVDKESHIRCLIAASAFICRLKKEFHYCNEIVVSCYLYTAVQCKEGSMLLKLCLLPMLMIPSSKHWVKNRFVFRPTSKHFTFCNQGRRWPSVISVRSKKSGRSIIFFQIVLTNKSLGIFCISIKDFIPNLQY